MIESFFIDILFQCDNELHRLISPLLMLFTNKAMATVEGGKRFGSIGRGLVVEGFKSPRSRKGETTSSDSDIIFNLGFAQIKVLCLLAELMLSYDSPEEQSDEGDHVEKPIMSNVAIENLKEDQFEELKQDLLKCSVFKIPTASTAVILPNKVKIQLQKFIINFCTLNKVNNSITSKDKV